MLKEKIKYCFDYGKSAEKRFAEKHITNIVYSNKNQDIYEHWDVMGILKEIGSVSKFDVKTTKRLDHSSDPSVGIMESVWVEGKNVNGQDGWIRGNSDYIVFERENTWMVVNRVELLNLTLSKLKENNYKKGKGVYLVHTRYKRKDKVTKVLFKDIKTINHFELEK